MRNNNMRGTGLADSNGMVPPRRRFGTLLRSEPNLPTPTFARDDDFSHHHHSVESSAAASPTHYVDGAATSSADASPLLLSPYTKSPWVVKSSPPLGDRYSPQNRPIGSMVREEGHVYSLATSDGDAGLLYTGSDSKNIRVWKNLKEFSGFKSSSGLVKAIVIWDEKVFTGHQDGKIRVWRVGSRNPTQHKRVGSLPTLKDYITASMNPRNYVEVRRHKTVIRIRHYDAVSCLSLNREQGLLYSGSWDKTLKVWRLSDSKCLESIDAHDDAVNAVVSGFDDLVFTGSADGTAKVWRRHLNGKKATTHFMVQLLMKSEFAVTALAVNQWSGVVYGGTSDGLVNFWEREKHLRHGGVLRGHKLAVLCLAAGGRFVFSGSSDKTICVWRRDGEADHTCLSVLSGHTGPVKCLAAREEDLSAEEEEGGRRWIVYSGSLDKSVKVWRVAEKVDFTKGYAFDNHAPPISPLERR